MTGGFPHAAAIALLFELVPFIVAIVSANVSLGSSGSIGIIGGADGPTAILVTSTLVSWPAMLVTALFLVAAIIGFRKTK